MRPVRGFAFSLVTLPFPLFANRNVAISYGASRTWAKLLPIIRGRTSSNNQRYLSSFSNSLDKLREIFVKIIDKEILSVKELKRSLSKLSFKGDLSLEFLESYHCNSCVFLFLRKINSFFEINRTLCSIFMTDNVSKDRYR